MRITVTSYEAFVENLEGEKVFRNTIYYHRADLPTQSEVEKPKALQLSTILDYGDEGQAILEAGIDCGKDVLAGNGHTDGTDQVDKLLEQMRSYCESHSISLKPGILEY